MCFASSIVEAHKKLFITGSGAIAAAAPSVETATPTRTSSSSAKTGSMSRSKSRLQAEVCGDCGASDPAWASINRGILLCSDCCSVHRSLGRHISMVKSLRQGSWEPSVLNFVNSLNAHGANSVWEHHLLDGATLTGGSKNVLRIRKPTPKDPLHPNKSDFIKAKHVNLAFVLKPNFQDDTELAGSNLEQELSKQLHASVRTSNLETSLRLVVQGADPNYFHEEKRSTPLHVAAKFGQASQIELLIVYGAEINAIDGNGLTPLEVARANNHNTIADRLIDALYDVTDRIITFLGGKKPDHASGRHLYVPEAHNAQISEQLKIARGRLQLVPNKMFEELVTDLYDEVERRENEAIWATSCINPAENVAVPFLPANPFLSATRNQGRQKLARFSRAEFAGLLTDVLIDARRRQNMANLRPMDGPTASAFYNQTTTASASAFNANEHEINISDDEPIYDPVASDDEYATLSSPIAQQTFNLPLPKTPPEAQYEMETLRKQLSIYESEINQLKTVVHQLSTENSELKSKFPVAAAVTTNCVYDEPLRIDLNGSENEPHSLPEGIGSNSTSASSSANNSNQSTIKRPASMYERRLPPTCVKTHSDSRSTTSMYQMAADKKFGEEVNQRTNLVTRRLKELIMAMQDAANKDALVPCGDRIRLAVMELICFFTAPANYNDTIRETLLHLSRNNVLLQNECENLQASYTSEDKASIERSIKDVHECAYNIASATKTLVVQYE